MAEKVSGWEYTCKRFVAFLDIMGFKDMVSRIEPIKLYNKLKKFRSAIYKSVRMIDESKIKPIIFSDSIMLVSKDCSRESQKAL